nr:hypothetical protein [uncultured Allomuricauda sp.]
MNFRYIIFLGFCISATSCASFKSTSTTGKIAQKLYDYKMLYIRPTSICDFSLALDNRYINAQYCEDYETKIKELSTALTVLNDYGKALEKISEENKFSTDDELDLIISKGESANWFTIGDESTRGIKKVISNTTKLFTNTSKRKNLREVVYEVNIPIQNLIDSLMLTELANRKIAYANVLGHLKNIDSQDEISKPDMRQLIDGKSQKISDTLFVLYNDLDNLTIKVLEQFLMEDLEKIDDYSNALKAFKKSHNKLYTEYRRIGTGDDAKITNEILGLIKRIYEGTRQL